jgi:hypothetical protein
MHIDAICDTNTNTDAISNINGYAIADYFANTNTNTNVLVN